MLNMIHLYKNEMEDEMNKSFISSENDIPLHEYVILAMKEFEAIKNIEILSYDIVMEPDEIDFNEHSININFKKKSGQYEIPKYKYLYTNRCGEIRFKIKIHTNLNQKIITKKILVPIEHDGFYDINNKKWKSLWQLVDASTYSQRGKITLKSRMPIIIYQHKKRPIIDVHGNIVEHSSYSYALNSSKPKRYGSSGKQRTKFINPLLIFTIKIGLRKTIDFFGMSNIIEIIDYKESVLYTTTQKYPDSDIWRYFTINEVLFRVNREFEENIKFVGSFVAMMTFLSNNDFPVTYENLNDKTYWICRIGYIGSAKSKNIMTFLEKGRTTIYMIERLLDSVTQMNLRLPEIYKSNIYYVLKWMIMDFDSLKNRNNMDMNNKRIRKNEYIVMSSLGKKISENINKLVEKKSKSKMNTMDTLLELFNFGSDIIINGMRNINDLIKSDELVNDMTWLQDLAFSCKGPNSLGEQSSKMISAKYRNIYPSFMGKVDVNVSSNSDVGMSGSFTPFVKLYDKFYFNPEKEPCESEYEIMKAKCDYFNNHSDIVEVGTIPLEIDFASKEDFIQYLSSRREIFSDLIPEEIEIIEKVMNTEPLTTDTHYDTIDEENEE